jgi:hypothetical protein
VRCLRPSPAAALGKHVGPRYIIAMDDLLTRVAMLEATVLRMAEAALHSIEREERANVRHDDTLIRLERIEELLRELRAVFRHTDPAS